MKTQIVYLEPHDDYNSVRDKLNWTQAPRVILVWPGRGRVLFRRFDLVMLQRYTRKNGIQMGLVTLDPDVLHHAESLQIPTFQSLDSQPEKAWRVRGERKISKPVTSGSFSSPGGVVYRTTNKHPRLNLISRIASFSVGFLAVILLILLLIPRAVITIEPEIVDLVETYPIGIDMGHSEIITSHPRLQTRRVQSVLEGQLRLPTTGTTAQPDQPAHGEVTFTNLTDQRLEIPAGTTVRTLDPTAPYFLTQSSIILGPEEGTQVSVVVTASLPGPEGNVLAEEIRAIDGPLGLSATVSNLEPFTGGSLEIRSAVASADLLRIRLELETNLLEKAHQALLGLSQEGEDIIPGSIRILETVETSFSNEIGDAADSLELSLVLEFEGQVYSPNQLFSVIKQVLNDDLSRGENIKPDSLKIIEISDIVPGDADEDPSIEVTISSQVYIGIDPIVIRKIVRGRDELEALEDLKAEVPFEEGLIVNISPAWLHRFPLLDLQIHVRYPWEADT
ncbi:MAG: baseplate J/gp47 family protein [Anaerolineales bacterium]